MCVAGRQAAVLASEDAFKGISFGSWLCCFAVIELRGDEHITFGSRSVSNEKEHSLMAGFEKEELFYPSWTK